MKIVGRSAEDPAFKQLFNLELATITKEAKFKFYH